MRVPRSEPTPLHPRIRKDLCADALVRTVKTEFESVPDGRRGKVGISMSDALMSGFALFSL